MELDGLGGLVVGEHQAVHLRPADEVLRRAVLAVQEDRLGDGCAGAPLHPLDVGDGAGDGDELHRGDLLVGRGVNAGGGEYLRQAVGPAGDGVKGLCAEVVEGAVGVAVQPPAVGSVRLYGKGKGLCVGVDVVVAVALEEETAVGVEVGVLEAVAEDRGVAQGGRQGCRRKGKEAAADSLHLRAADLVAVDVFRHHLVEEHRHPAEAVALEHIGVGVEERVRAAELHQGAGLEGGRHVVGCVELRGEDVRSDGRPGGGCRARGGGDAAALLVAEGELRDKGECLPEVPVHRDGDIGVVEGEAAVVVRVGKRLQEGTHREDRALQVGAQILDRPLVAGLRECHQDLAALGGVGVPVIVLDGGRLAGVGGGEDSFRGVEVPVRDPLVCRGEVDDVPLAGERDGDAFVEPVPGSLDGGLVDGEVELRRRVGGS